MAILSNGALAKGANDALWFFIATLMIQNMASVIAGLGITGTMAQLLTAGLDIVVVVLSAAILSQKGWNDLVAWYNNQKTTKNDAGVSSIVGTILLGVVVLIAAAGVYVYLFGVDVMTLINQFGIIVMAAVALVASAITWFEVSVLKKKPAIQPKQWIGVSIIDDVSSGVGKSAIIAYNLWIKTYGFKFLQVGGQIPKALMSVYIDDNTSCTSGLYYDFETNMLYALPNCPLFREHKLSNERLYNVFSMAPVKVLWLQQNAALISASLDKEVTAAQIKDEIVGFTAADKGQEVYDLEYANILRDDGANGVGLKVFCKLTGWIVPGQV
jgi:hypothetical protein